MSSNLSRWAKASIALNFQDQLPNHKILVTGMRWNPIENGREPGSDTGSFERIELRLEGPMTRQRSNLRQRHTFIINVLLTSSKDTENFYKHDELVDKARALFKDKICMYKIDRDSEAPFEPFGVSRVEKTLQRQIFIYNHGQREPNLNIEQTTIVARYWVDEVYR